MLHPLTSLFDAAMTCILSFKGGDVLDIILFTLVTELSFKAIIVIDKWKTIYPLYNSAQTVWVDQ